MQVVKPNTRYAVVTLELAVPVAHVPEPVVDDWCRDAIDELMTSIVSGEQIPPVDEWRVRRVSRTLVTPADPAPGDIFNAAVPLRAV